MTWRGTRRGAIGTAIGEERGTRPRALAENIPLCLYFFATTRNSNDPGSTVGQGFGGTGGPSLPEGK